MSELVDRAAQSEEIIITRRSAQVARLMPPQALDALGQARALTQRIWVSRAQHPFGANTSIREMIEECQR